MAASEAYASNTGVSIVWDRRSLQEFADVPILELASKYDFIVLDHPHVGLIADAECLLPLPMPPNAEEMSLGGSLESYIWRNQLWALPIDAACQMAVKRPDLCRQELPNWDAVLVALPADYKIVTPLLPVDAFDMMMTLVAGRGEEDLPHSSSLFTSEKNSLYALKILKVLFKLGPAEAISWNPIKVLEALATIDDFHYSPCLFGYINYARPGFRSHQLAYVDLPSFADSTLKRGILGGAGIGVSAQTQHCDAALAFASWVSSQPVQSGVYLENEGQPAHLQTWREKGSDPRYSGFLYGGLHTMINAWTRPRDAWFLRFVDDVCEIFPDFFLNDISEETFLRDINRLFHEHFSKAESA